MCVGTPDRFDYDAVRANKARKRFAFRAASCTKFELGTVKCMYTDVLDVSNVIVEMFFRIRFCRPPLCVNDARFFA